LKNNINLRFIRTPYDYQIIDIFLDDDGIADIQTLKNLSLPDNHDTSKGVILFGRGPIWLYAFLTHLCHKFPFVGIFDPRIGAIIIETHKKNSYEIGDVIPSQIILEKIEQQNIIEREGFKLSDKHYIAIAIIGPPHSGKSVLIHKIRQQIANYIDGVFLQRNFYILRACPDGEGNWSDEVDSSYVKLLRYKNKFNDSFVNKILDHLSSISQSKKLILVDCGGIIDKYNQMIWNLCTHTIIVSNNNSLISEWRGAAKASNLNILAEIESRLENVSSVKETDTSLKLILGPLDRDESNVILPSIIFEKLRSIIVS